MKFELEFSFQKLVDAIVIALIVGTFIGFAVYTSLGGR